MLGCITGLAAAAALPALPLPCLLISWRLVDAPAFCLAFPLFLAWLCSQAAETPEQAIVHGPASPAFQLCLLATLQQCMPRIQRRPLHFLADLLHMQLRWAAAALPSLLLGDASEDGDASAKGQLDGQQLPLTVAAAVRALARMAGSVAAWADGQLAEGDRCAAMHLQAAVLLQLASLSLQLPQALEEAAAAVEAAQQRWQGGRGAGGAAPAAGSRLPLMQAAATELLRLPGVLWAALPGGGGQPGGCASIAASPEAMQKLAAGLDGQLAAAGVDAADLAHFCAAEAAEGAAAAACAAACSGGTPVEQQAKRLRELLPAAACLLLDSGAHQQSVPLTLLPLCALCTACNQLAASAAAGGLAGSGSVAQLTASTPALDRLLSALVAVMSHNPVQLLRSCAHDALHAVLDAFQPAARLAQLRRLLQVSAIWARVPAQGMVPVAFSSNNQPWRCCREPLAVGPVLQRLKSPCPARCACSSCSRAALPDHLLATRAVPLHRGSCGGPAAPATGAGGGLEPANCHSRRARDASTASCRHRRRCLAQQRGPGPGLALPGARGGERMAR